MAKAPALKNNQRKSTKGGARPGAGRPKGVPNKLTKTIKDAIEAAFDQVGGPDYLARMAEEQPVAFMSLLGKVLPTQLQHSGSIETMSKEQRDAAVAAAMRADGE